MLGTPVPRAFHPCAATQMCVQVKLEPLCPVFPAPTLSCPESATFLLGQAARNLLILRFLWLCFLQSSCVTNPWQSSRLIRKVTLLGKPSVEGLTKPPEVLGPPAIRPNNSCTHQLLAQAETSAQALYRGHQVLTECSSWSTLCARTGLNDTGDRAPGFFLTARICSRARKARREQEVVTAQPSRARPCQSSSPCHRHTWHEGAPLCTGSGAMERPKAKRWGWASIDLHREGICWLKKSGYTEPLWRTGTACPSTVMNRVLQVLYKCRGPKKFPLREQQHRKKNMSSASGVHCMLQVGWGTR